MMALLAVVFLALAAGGEAAVAMGRAEMSQGGLGEEKGKERLFRKLLPVCGGW